MPKKKKTNRNIKEAVKCLLWGISAGRCERCGRSLYKHSTFKELGNYSQIAHNIPVNEGARFEYLPINGKQSINDVNNLLLLCYDCHRLIDAIKPNDYPPDVLLCIKRKHEEFVDKATNRSACHPFLVVQYAANLHGRQELFPNASEVLFPNGYIDCIKDISNKGSLKQPHEDDYWTIETQNLERQYDRNIRPYIEENTAHECNIAVFARAPIPLLVELGTLLSNKNNIQIFQFHKATSSWLWPESDSTYSYRYRVIQKGESSNDIVLIISLSGRIREQEARESFNCQDKTIVEIYVEETYDDSLQTKKQLEDFVEIFQRTKEHLRQITTGKPVIHLFAAIPISVALEIGRHRNPISDLPYLVYFYNGSKYIPAIHIGE